MRRRRGRLSRSIATACVVSAAGSGGITACRWFIGWDELHETDGARAHSTDAAGDAELGAVPGRVVEGDAQSTGTADAGHRGAWCAQNGAGKTDCWDFDVDGAPLVNGWDHDMPNLGSTELTSDDYKSSPRAFLATLDDPGSIKANAVLRSPAYTTASHTQLEFYVKPEACSADDGKGAVIAVVSVDTDATWPPRTWWDAMVFYSGSYLFLAATRYVDQVPNTDTGNDCGTGFSAGSNVCRSTVSLDLGTWNDVLLDVQINQATNEATLRLGIGSAPGIGPWTVPIEPPAATTRIGLGLAPIDHAGGCQATFDNVTLNITQ